MKFGYKNKENSSNSNRVNNKNLIENNKISNKKKENSKIGKKDFIFNKIVLYFLLSYYQHQNNKVNRFNKIWKINHSKNLIFYHKKINKFFNKILIK